MHESDVIEQFCAAMRERDINVNAADIVPDGQFRRIKVKGDKDKSAWYVLHSDGIPAGAFGCNRRYGNDTKFTWRAKTSRKFTEEERRAYRERMARIEAERAREKTEMQAAAAKIANEIWDAAQPCDAHPYLERKGIRSHGLRIGRWDKVDQETGEVYFSSDEALLIPIRDAKKRIHSLQAIFPDKVLGGRDKDYLHNGAKEGLFYSFGKPLEHDGKPVIMIGEGYATCASVHEATGHACIVAFDAPNLLPVTKVIRGRFPNAIIVILADNDQWTVKPVKNPGVTRAMECAKEYGALVAIPPFDPSLGETKETGGRAHGPTDFNDLQEIEGPEAVRAVIDAVLNGEPEPDPEPEPEYDDMPPWEGDDPAADDPEPAQTPDKNGYFTILGYDRGYYYIFRHGTRQIATYTKSDFSDTGLIELAPVNWWEFNFAGDRGGYDRKAAVNFLIRTAESKGIYDIARIRGRGAWFDEGRAVYHHGGYLTVDGQRVDVTEFRSQYIYELAKSLPDPHERSFTVEEGQNFLDLTKKFRWAKPGSALLFSGWIALAPVCGALPWRPHIWLSGGAGSGKSTLAKLAHGLLRGTDVFAQGSSSEAGIRQRLKSDALPVIMDESESNEESDVRRIQSILALIRQASTESDAETLKGTADGSGMAFHIRSMFCLASIQVALKHKADIDRLSVLSLRSGRTAKHGDEIAWRDLQESIYSTVDRDPTVAQRFLRRSIDLLPTTIQNINVFTDVAAQIFGSQRDGDQYGTLIAGAWSLMSDGVATYEEAEKLITSYDWSEHLENAETDESQLALAALMEGKVRISGVEVTVYELICVASDMYTPGLDIDRHKADAILQRHGMRVKDGCLLLANASQELRRLVAGTPYEADLRGMLLRVPGADRNDNKPLKFNGVQSKCIRLPLGPILNDAPIYDTDDYNDTEPF